MILVNMTAGLKPSPGADVAGMSSIPAQMWQGRAHSVPVQMWAGVSPITRVTTHVGPEALSLDRRVVNEDVLRAAVGPYKAVSCSYRYKATLPKWETHTPVSRDTWRPLKPLEPKRPLNAVKNATIVQTV